MERLFHRLAEAPLVVTALATFLVVGWILFRRRVRREESPAYLRPLPGGGVRRD